MLSLISATCHSTACSCSRKHPKFFNPSLCVWLVAGSTQAQLVLLERYVQFCIPFTCRDSILDECCLKHWARLHWSCIHMSKSLKYCFLKSIHSCDFGYIYACVGISPIHCHNNWCPVRVVFSRRTCLTFTWKSTMLGGLLGQVPACFAIACIRVAAFVIISSATDFSKTTIVGGALSISKWS